MNENKSNDLIDYLSLSLVLSFVLFNNIYIVILGIVLSVYSINKEKIYYFIDSYKRKIIVEDKIKKDDKNRMEYIEEKLDKEDSALLLAERIELLGFIPSEINEDNNRVA